MMSTGKGYQRPLLSVPEDHVLQVVLSLQNQYFPILEGYEKNASKSYQRTGEGKMWEHGMLGVPDKVCRKGHDSRDTRRTSLQKADSIPSWDLL